MRSAVLVCAAALSACGASISSPAAAPPQTLAVAGASPLADEADRSPSWISRDAKNAVELLYVSDLRGFAVHIYDFPSLKPAGKLTGFDEPQGLCSDTAGNVWVTNTLTYQIVEFAHGKTKPIAKLADPLGLPVGCAIDPRSGDLAVTNVADFSGAASVLVYKHATGTPSAYGNSNQVADYFAGYDAKGNLYVSGNGSKGAYALTVLRNGSDSLASVKVSGATIGFPGTVAWHNTTLVLGDQSCKKKATSCLYRASVTGLTARVTASVSLGGSCDVAEVWVGTAQIAGGDDEANCRYGHSSVDRWPYPAGGAPSASTAGVGMPVGATVSRRG
ncbi:MAG TPA: hypothetical protein VEW74_09200, partial [Candidatus Nitrosotalea sp.]|nr:hypothetical protein [Candidatus Nitrosotalea sp.]